ncbi:MAG: DNA polymerase III subunit delta' [Alphaproteobacteria bacterium]|nr:DNA polymerase III subunit delta' [Alphaproteobacteria bacterium]
MSDTDGAAPPAPVGDLVGHENAADEFRRTVAGGRVAHAWLLTGPRGIGKATFAVHMASYMLSGAHSDDGGLFDDKGGSRGAFQAAPGNHPDLVMIRREPAPDTGKIAKEIPIEAIRKVTAFLRLTPAAGGWRAVIIDSADELNRNAANALLKLLEEPPGNVLIVLISHAPRSLLPTIRSRCRQLALSPLSSDATRSVLESLMPDAAPNDLALATSLSEGCPGRGLGLLSGEGLTYFREVADGLEKLPDIDVGAVDALGDTVARARDDIPFHRVFECFEWWLSQLVRTSVGLPASDCDTDAVAVWRRLAERRSLEQWLEVWDKISRLHRRTEYANLDRKQAVISAFNIIEAAARP